MVSQARIPALAQAALRAIAFVVLPLLLAALVLRWLVPPPGSSEGVLGWVAIAGNQFPVALGAALFLLFAWLLRYWRWSIPGGRFLTALPARIAVGVDRKDLRTYASAAELLRALEKDSKRARWNQRLDREAWAALSQALQELSDALEGTDAARVEAAARAAESIVAPVRKTLQRRQTLLFAAGISVAAAAAMLLRVAMFESYQVLSSSMLPTLEGGDRVLANKLAYGFALAPGSAERPKKAPRRGDLVVFRNRTGEGPPHLVKRVVGLPGDRMTMRGDHPIINGWEVPFCDAGTYVYPYVGGVLSGRLRVEFLDDRAFLTIQLGEKQPLREPHVVRPGETFVLGDNRSNSTDSRSWNGGRGGGVAFGDIDGRVQWFLASTHRDGRADFGRLFHSIGRELRFDGVDLGPLRQGIERCVTKEWPKQTVPPPEPPQTSTAGETSIVSERRP